MHPSPLHPALGLGASPIRQVYLQWSRAAADDYPGQVLVFGLVQGLMLGPGWDEGKISLGEGVPFWFRDFVFRGREEKAAPGCNIYDGVFEFWNAP